MTRMVRQRARSLFPYARSGLVLGAIALVVLVWPGVVQAFKQRYHERITLDVLLSLGFDVDSADEVADSNWWTDPHEFTNEAAHADNNKLGAASARLRHKLFYISDDLSVCDRRNALDKLGEALHTVQDIYSHSNAVDNGHLVKLLELKDGTAACDASNNFAPDGLITGYFPCILAPENSCCHSDLNKDSPDQANGARHELAKDAARSATYEFLRYVEEEVRLHNPGRGEQLMRLLKRKQRTNFFVIDDTGSMSADLDGVKAEINAFLDEVEASDESPTLGLITFKDSATNWGVTCDDISGLRARINSLYASGGDDCPEAMNVALMTALEAVPEDRSDMLQQGRILLATDASARDPNMGPIVQNEAYRLGIGIDAILTGDCVAEGLEASSQESCEAFSVNEPGADLSARESTEEVSTAAGPNPLTSPSARTYLRALTEQTGGVLFMVGRTEVDDVVPTLLALGDPSTAIVMTRRVQGAPGSSTTLEIPVDESFYGAVNFMVTSSTRAGLPTFELRRPDGTVVNPADPGVTYRLHSSVATYAIQSPTVGTWRVTLTGGARSMLRVFGPTSLRLNGLRYIVPDAPKPGHSEEVAIEGLPIAGSSLVAQARLTAAPGTATLRLRRQDGSLISESATARFDERRFRAPVVIPEELFLVELAGQTSAGNAYVRQLPVAVMPRTVLIRATPELGTAVPGESATIKVTVTNTSSVPATYTLQATSSLGWPRIVPAPFSVGPGATTEVTVLVRVPDGTPAGTRSGVSLAVQDASSPGAYNSTSVEVESAAASPCIEVRLSDYNLFVLEDYSGGTDVKGRVAAGGDITMTNFSVGAALPESNSSQVLLAGGDLTLSQGGIWGSAFYGGSYTADSSVVSYRGGVSKGAPIDFAARGARLRKLSTQLAGLPVNGTSKRESWGGVMLSGSDPKVNVFAVNANDFTGAALLSINAPAGSLVVINLTGGAATFTGFSHAFSGGIDQRGILFNFVDATAINAHAYGFWGTVLAPYAHVSFSNGSFDGGIFARSMTGNAEGHLNALHDRELCE
jgi:choice-of-anchor A domain-containing protein